MKLQPEFKKELIDGGSAYMVERMEAGLCPLCGMPVKEEDLKDAYFGPWQMGTCPPCTTHWKKLSKFNIITDN